MDPDEAHRQLESALLAMDGAMNTSEYLAAASDLWTAASSLNEWIKNGGFLPAAWKNEWSQ